MVESNGENRRCFGMICISLRSVLGMYAQAGKQFDGNFRRGYNYSGSHAFSSALLNHPNARPKVGGTA